MTVTATLSCGHEVNVHEASSLFDYPECVQPEHYATTVRVTAIDGVPVLSTGAVVDPVRLVVELDARDLSAIADALMSAAAGLDRKANDMFRQPSREFQTHAKAGRLRALANAIEEAVE